MKSVLTVLAFVTAVTTQAAQADVVQRTIRCIGTDQGVYSFTQSFTNDRLSYSRPSVCLNNKCSFQNIKIERTELVEEIEDTGFDTDLRTVGSILLMCVTNIGEQD